MRISPSSFASRSAEELKFFTYLTSCEVRYLENLNAHFISDGLAQPERLAKLNAIAIHQMTLLTRDMTARLISGE